MASSSAPAESGAVLRSPEEPPGLDRVRRFLARPLAAVRFVWLWVRWIGIHLGRGLAVAGRSAYRGARIAQAAGAVAESVGKVGGRLDGMGQNWSRAGGRLGRVGGRLANAGRRMRAGGSRWATTARGAAGVGVALGELHEAITGEAPEGEKPVVPEPVVEPLVEPVVEPVAEALPEPGARARAERDVEASPTPAGVRPAVGPAAAGGRGRRAGAAGPAADSRSVVPKSPAAVPESLSAGPRARRSSPEAGSGGGLPAVGRRTGSERPGRAAGQPGPPSADRPVGEPAAPTVAVAAPAVPTDAEPDPPEPDPVVGEPEAQAERPGEPGAGPRSSAASDSPSGSASGASPPAGASGDAPATPTTTPSVGDLPERPAASSSEQLPEALREAIRNLSERPRRADLRAVILRLCAGQWRTESELAAWLGRDARNLRRRYFGPMVAAGRLESRRPAGARKTRREYRVPGSAPG